MDFGHVIFVFLIKSSSIVCEHKEHKLCVFLVIQDFGGFDATICWLDCEAVEKKEGIEIVSFSEWIEREKKMNLITYNLF